jgi:hypothetical protein
LQTGRPSSPSSARSGSRGGRRSRRPNRQRTRRSLARPRQGKGRGGHGEHVEVLTCGEETLRRPEPGRRRARAARRPGGGGAGSAQARSEAASRDGWLGRWSPYKRAARGWPWRARLSRGSGGAALLRQMGSAGLAAGPRWAEADRVGSGLRARPRKKWIVFFFPNLFSMPKQIPGKSRNYLKARKILRKSQKFQENS